MTTDRFGHLYSQNTLKTKPSAIRDICSLVNQPDVRSLAGGWPDPAVFPQDEMIEVATELLRDQGPKVLQYGSSEGLDELRLELARQARDEGNTECQPDEILITHGSAQGMDLITRVFMDPGDIVMAGLDLLDRFRGTVNELLKTDSNTEHPTASDLVARVVPTFKKSMDNDLRIGDAFNSVHAILRKLESHKKRGEWGRTTAATLEKALRDIDRVMAVLFV